MNTYPRLLCGIALFVMPIVSTLSAAATTHSGQLHSLEATYPNSFNVYVSGPEDASRGILLIHGWLGLNDHLKGLADQFANMGYRAMAIDLYNGQVATGPKQARVLMDAVRQKEANAKYVSAIQALKSGGRDVAVIGWSFGGSQAMHATLAASHLVSATVCYYPYGEMPAGIDRLSQMNGPLLIQVGTQDFAFTGKKIDAYRVAMQAADKTLIVNTYDAKHSFDSSTSDNYNQAAQEEAWFTTGKFLDRYLD